MSTPPIQWYPGHIAKAEQQLKRHLDKVDLVIEAGLNPYDIQAPQAVVEAAGGIVTSWDGGPAHMGGRVIAAANRDIHAEALAILQGV